MYYKSDVTGFVKAIWKMASKGASCSAVFLSDSGGWGKMILHDGQIKALRYQSNKGGEALKVLGDLGKLQYQFREEHAKLTDDSNETIDNQTFFSNFRMEIPPDPNAPEEPASEAQPAASAAPPTHRIPTRHKILIADDSRLIRKALERMLTSAGYQVAEAEDGFKVLGMLENDHHHLILLDLVMPGIDGYKVLSYIRQHETHRKVPVFILTARDGMLDKVKGHMSEAQEYLTKPVDEKILLGKIARYLDQEPT